MLYKSLKNYEHIVSFDKAVINGLAPLKGLYYPMKIPVLSNNFFEKIEDYNIFDIALEVIHPYIGGVISKKDLLFIIKNTLNFNFPLYNIHDNIYSLELFHGPTLAFKDVGAKFMAYCLEKIKCNNKKITVIVATSGDTGGAVANGFHKISNVNVVILYPSGRISDIQEKQISTLGDNIQSIEIEGTFDDCQNIVKNAFLDEELKKSLKITSANSINIARLLPQMFYYFDSFKKIKNKNCEIVFSVPSGNFGNIFAGMLSKAMGLPIKHFISATNINDTVPRYMKSGKYEPKKTYSTISNAMDISDPSNFSRIRELYNNDISLLRKSLSAYSFSDKETLDIIIEVQKKYNYILDPHGAIGYLGLKKYLSNLNYKKNNIIGIFLETAHPIKFIDKMPDFFRKKIIMPLSIDKLLLKSKNTIKLSNNFKCFKSWLLNNI